MPRLHNSLGVKSCVFAGLMLAACHNQPQDQAQPTSPPAEIGLLTSLPVYWPEAADMADMLAQSNDVPWPRAVIEQQHRLIPLDALNGPRGLARVRAVLLAQPRPLSAAENVALDDWVRAGGHVLLFADPVLTAESQFHMGDKRRPMDVALLSPILSRWGLVLTFDEGSAAGERNLADPVAGELPVNEAGQWQLDPKRGPAAGECRLEAARAVARCTIGQGSATIVADASLFEAAADDRMVVRQQALSKLIDSLAEAAAGTAREKPGEGQKTPAKPAATDPPDRLQEYD